MINPPKLQMETNPAMVMKTPMSTPLQMKRVTIMSSEDTESISGVNNFVDNVSLDRPQDHLLEY